MNQKIIHRYLSNGMEVYLHQTDFAPVVSLQVLVKVGSLDEEEQEGGVAHVLEHMLFKGTKKFPQLGQIASTVEQEGGDINAYTTFDHTNYYLTAPSEFVMAGAELLLDVVQNSLLSPEELKKELEVIREEIKRSKDSPSSILSHNLFATFYKGTRLNRPIIGYEDIVTNFDRETVFHFYKKWYCPNNMIFIAAGNFEAQDLLNHLETLSSNFNPISVPTRTKEMYPQLDKPRCVLQRGDWQEVRLQLTTPAPTLEDHDMPAWDLFAAILGDNDSSRLVRILKEELCLVTSIDCSCFTPKSPQGIFGVGFFGMSQNTTEALKIIVQEIRRLAEIPPAQEELVRIVNALKAHRIYSQESMDGITRNAGLSLQTSAKMNFESQYLDKVIQTSAKEIQQIALHVLKQISQGQFVIAATIGKEVLKEVDEQHFIDIVLREAQAIPLLDSTDVLNAGPEEKEREDAWRTKYNLRISSLNEDVQQIEILLPQGKKLKINFRRSNRLPVASGTLILKGGLCFEPQGKNGVGGLTASMLVKGTRQQSYRKFIEELEDKASSISAFSSRDLFGLRFDSLEEHSLRTIQMLLDCFFRPEFSSIEWERLLKETQEILIAQKDSPMASLSKIAQPLIFPDHPYANPGIGTQTSLQNINLQDAQNFWKNIFQAEEFIFSIAGHFNLKSIVTLLESEFLTYFRENNFPTPLQTPPSAHFPKSRDKRFAFHELNREQTHITLSFRALPITDPKRTALEVATHILAGQGGRLFLDLRDQKSLAYSVSASQSPNLQGGVFTTYIACASGKTKEAMEGLKYHIEKCAHTAPSEEEVKRAQKSILGAQCIESQHHSYQASQLSMGCVFGLPFDHFLNFAQRVHAVTPELVRDVLRDLLTHNPPIFAVVGSKDSYLLTENDPLLSWTNSEVKSTE